MTLPGVKQFRQEGCLSYLIFDRDSREGFVLDPRFDLMEDYRAFIAERGLKIRFALDTHIHADHDSATHLFRQEYGAEIAMCHLTRSERPGRRLRHGDSISAGSLRLEALETPGHTPDGMSFYGAGMVFTGDTLFVGATGRTDFPGADPAQQWESLHSVLGKLPDSTLVMPGHDYSDMLFSTIGAEKRLNPHLRMPSKEAFIAMKREEGVPTASDEIRRHIAFNTAAAPEAPASSGGPTGTACGSACAESGPISTLSVEKYAPKLKARSRGFAFVDVREPEEYLEGHMPGAENIPLSELGLHLARLAQSKRVYVSCLSGRRSAMAAKTLSYLGLGDVVNVSGGYKAWTGAGLPVKTGQESG